MIAVAKRDAAAAGLSESGEMALLLAAEITALRGGKKRVDIHLLEKIRDALGSGQFGTES